MQDKGHAGKQLEDANIANIDNPVAFWQPGIYESGMKMSATHGDDKNMKCCNIASIYPLTPIQFC